MVFVEPNPQPAEAPKKPASESGGLVISKGFLGALIVLLLGATIAGTGGFYWLWQGAVETGKKDVAVVQAKLKTSDEANKVLTDAKTALTTERDTIKATLSQYNEIERLKALTAAERTNIDNLLKIPSKADYWKYRKPVDLKDPVFRETVEAEFGKKLALLQAVSADLGKWERPAGPGPSGPAGQIRPAPRPN